MAVVVRGASGVVGVKPAITKAEHDAIAAATGRPVTQGPRQRHRPAELMGGEAVTLPVIDITPRKRRPTKGNDE